MPRAGAALVREQADLVRRQLAAEEDRFGVSRAERRKAAELRGELQVDLAGVQLGVDAKPRRELLGVQRFPALRFQRIGERADAGGIQSDARRVLVAAELRQVVRAAGQRVVEMKALHAAPGPLGDTALLGNDQRGPVEPFHQPRRHDSDHTDVPPRRRHHQRPPLLRRSELLRMRDGLARDPRLQLLPLGVGAV